MARYAFGTAIGLAVSLTPLSLAVAAESGRPVMSIGTARAEIRAAITLRGNDALATAGSPGPLHVIVRQRQCPPEDRLPSPCAMIVRDLD